MIIDSASRRRAAGLYTNDRRKRPMVTITLSPEALAYLDVVAGERGQTRSGAVEGFVRKLAAARGIKLENGGK
jgi:hypothetical protein